MIDIAGKQLDDIAGNGGSYVLTGTGSVTGVFRAFIVNDDAVINVMTDVNNADMKTIYGISGNPTLKSGMLITAASGGNIKTISLTSGSIILYRA